MAAKGLAKLIEECGELIQVCGKKLAVYHNNEHWDGTDLKDRMEQEMADVEAAIAFVAWKLGLEASVIMQRRMAKLKLFQEWEADLTNNTNGVDAERLS